MAPEPNFESMSSNTFSNNNSFSDSNQDPNVNFLLDNIPFLNTECFSPSDVKIGFSEFESPDTFSILYFNIRSLRKNFEDFKKLYKTLNLKFSIVCFSETWADENKLANNSLIQLPDYNVLHQIRKNRSVGVQQKGKKLHKTYVSLWYDTNHKHTYMNNDQYSNFKKLHFRSFCSHTSLSNRREKICNKSEQHIHKRIFNENSIE